MTVASRSTFSHLLDLPSSTVGDLTLEEREKLIDDTLPHFTAFSPRPGSQFDKSPSSPDVKMNVNHKLRTFREESTVIYPLDSFQTWIDAGKLDPACPDQPDPAYNANVWRHFSPAERGATHSRGGGSKPGRVVITDVIAAMHPLHIPPPSRMGEFTYARFIRAGDVFRDPERKAKKVTLTEQELAEMKKLRMMSDARVPPTDNKGHILPPLTYRRRKSYGRRLPTHDAASSYESYQKQRDVVFSPEKISETLSLASRNTSLRHKGSLWKFSYKLNNPEYNKVLENQREKERWKANNAHIKEMKRRAILGGY